MQKAHSEHPRAHPPPNAAALSSSSHTSSVLVVAAVGMVIVFDVSLVAVKRRALNSAPTAHTEDGTVEANPAFVIDDHSVPPSHFYPSATFAEQPS